MCSNTQRRQSATDGTRLRTRETIVIVDSVMQPSHKHARFRRPQRLKRRDYVTGRLDVVLRRRAAGLAEAASPAADAAADEDELLLEAEAEAAAGTVL